MKEIINIVLLLVLGIFYIISFSKVISRYINSFAPARNNAVTVLYISGIAASGIILIDISKVITDSFIYFYDQQAVGNAILYNLSYFVGSWGFSIGFFFFSFVLTSFLTKENEKEALKNNHVELALVHGTLLIILSFLVGPALTNWAFSFIPYPELPY